MEQNHRLTGSSTFMLIFLIQLSSAYPQGPDYYLNYTHENFRKDKLLNDTLDFDHIDLTRLNAALFFVTNEIRIKNKLNPLEYAPELEKAASVHSRDMVMRDFFSHTNPYQKKKETPNDRARMIGISNPFIAENIAEDFGFQYESGTNVYLLGKGIFSYHANGERIPANTYLSLAESFLERWMHSSEHKKNVLSTEALQLGCGTFFFIDPEFNDMPTFMGTQNFQWFEKIKLLKEYNVNE
ncbi:MAG: CAP domain-containing protein [Bacteroidales bacterium]|nr:CAP domain-containing protein [Bacteroidales bacterium]